MAQPIEFPEQNFVWQVPKGAESVMRPLPAFVEWGRGPDGKKAAMNTVSKWELSDDEIAWIVENRVVYLKQHNAGNPLQAQLIIAGPLEFPKPFAFCEVAYRPERSLEIVWIWNSGNLDIPNVISIEGILHRFASDLKPLFRPDRSAQAEGYFFRNGTAEENSMRAKSTILEWEQTDHFKNMKPEEVKPFEDHIIKQSFLMPVLILRKHGGEEVLIC